ncbi:MAG TPA: prephenate dehydrogenase/arogenate dehydrogenase family protein [Methylovorus sp.]|nr:prephenate dehydrogenase/arogenate dehydrogenase family protein [Methylovorus sp.]
MNKLVIFGVGLIGGSVALALKQSHAVRHIVGIGRDGDHLQAALDLGVIDEAQTSVASALDQADMVLIAAPVAQTLAILQGIAPHLASSTIVTDAGSTKSDIVGYAQHALGDRHLQFVPGHPIAGAEKSGVTAARADLFQNRNVVLTPFEQTAAPDIARVQTMWEACGAHVTTMTAAQHDRIFAAVSHLPHLLAFALVNELASRTNADQLFDFAASGFRDFSRIAGSHPEMWRDISLANQAALLEELDAYQAQLSHVRELLQQQDGAALQQLFERASHARNAWARHKKY